MKGAAVVSEIKARGGSVLRQKGSHVRVACTCGKNHSTVPVHKGSDLPIGTLRAIERDLAPCFGEGWLR
jgi:predicted RNA binding protein YcfA (HicA-like mRNA interferase family)